jgi:hypothetical protein
LTHSYREREAAVNERRQLVDAAMQLVGRAADPQTDAAIRIVAWATHRALQPAGNDFAMLQLVLLALLPQIGGILLMVGRSANWAAAKLSHLFRGTATHERGTGTPAERMSLPAKSDRSAALQAKL